MKWVLFGLGILAALAGAAVLGSAASAIHEILGAVCFQTAAVFVSSGAIIESIEKWR